MRDDQANEAAYAAIKHQEKRDTERQDRSNQDEYDVIQAQQEWDSKTMIEDAPDELTTVDVDRSELSQYVNDLFTAKYAVNPLQPPGQLVQTWMMLHDEVQNIIQSLEETIGHLRAAVENEKTNEPEEKHFTS